MTLLFPLSLLLSLSFLFLLILHHSLCLLYCRHMTIYMANNISNSIAFGWEKVKSKKWLISSDFTLSFPMPSFQLSTHFLSSQFTAISIWSSLRSFFPAWTLSSHRFRQRLLFWLPKICFTLTSNFEMQTSNEYTGTIMDNKLNWKCEKFHEVTCVYYI